MSAPEGLTPLVGKWTGTSRLWLAPGAEPEVSESAARVALAARGRFLVIEYTWAYKGEPQEGMQLLGAHRDGVTAIWIDSWHMGDAVMRCEGTPGDPARVVVRGSYAAPPGPDWGWQIAIEGAGERLRVVMDNISPDGHPERAVEADYVRG